MQKLAYLYLKLNKINGDDGERALWRNKGDCADGIRALWWNKATVRTAQSRSRYRS